MLKKFLLVVTALLSAQGMILAQGPGMPNNGYNWNMGNYNQENYLKGWYLYWPAEALLQPRRPMPYPWWPAHANNVIPIQPGIDGAEEVVPGNPRTVPGPLTIPQETPSLPPVPGNKTSYYPANRAVQPVSYPQSIPSYWYNR